MLSFIFSLIGGALYAVFAAVKFLFRAKVVRVIIIISLIIFVPIFIMDSVSPGLGQRAAAHAFSAVYSANLYNYSKDIYKDSIIRGYLRVTDYTAINETPYYSTVISHDKLDDKEPLGVLPAESVVELRNIYTIKRINKNNSADNNDAENTENTESLTIEAQTSDADIYDAWGEVFFHTENKPQFAYILLPETFIQTEPHVRSIIIYATVSTPVLNVRTGPSTNHDVKDTLIENTRVEVLEVLNDLWVIIRYGDNKTGYAYRELLTF